MSIFYGGKVGPRKGGCFMVMPVAICMKFERNVGNEITMRRGFRLIRERSSAQWLVENN